MLFRSFSCFFGNMNDLDIITLNVLESFLLDFPGCLIVVSHDRYLMDKIIDHLFVFKGSGNIENFPGNYSDYRAYEDSIDLETMWDLISTLKKDGVTVILTTHYIKEAEVIADRVGILSKGKLILDYFLLGRLVPQLQHQLLGLLSRLLQNV